MKLLLIDASPKAEKSVSRPLLKDFVSFVPHGVETRSIKLNSPENSYGEFIDKLNWCESAVLAFPVYIDSVPSHILKVMCRICDEQPLTESKKIYCLVNCGFYEGIQCRTALEIVRNWCSRSGLSYMGGIGFGGGGGFAPFRDVPPGKGPKESLGKALNDMSACAACKTGFEDIFISLGIPKEIYKSEGEAGWRRAADKNGLSEADLSRKI